MPEANYQMLQRADVSIQHALGHIAALAAILPSELTETALRAMAERLYSERRRRDGYFPAGLFGEPAWDLTLALFVAREEGREVSLAEACEAAGVGRTAGRRLLAKMEEAELVARTTGRADRRRQCVALTDNGAERLTDYLTGLL